VVRGLVFIAAAATSCTWIVENQLSSRQPLDAGPCNELRFDDGTDAGGYVFHGGVTAPAFRGPAYPPAGRTADNFGSTLAFLVDGGVVTVGGYQSDQVFLRGQNYLATWVVPTPGHEGPGGFGCSEIFAATYDSLRDRTSYQLLNAGCGQTGQEDQSFDGGSFPGPPDPNGPALAWAGSGTDGGTVAVAFATLGESCPEVFPLSCFPPHGGSLTTGAGRRMDALVDASGQPVWMVAIAGADTRLYDAKFRGSIGAVSWAGPISALAPDVGVVMRIHSGQLEGQLFDSTGAKRANEAHFDLGDSAAHGLEISRLGTTPVVRAAWIGGDGWARVASVDFSSSTSPRLSTPALVCGSQGASFVGPTSATTAAVLIGEALYLRHVQ
jgi:hypothetical protein